MTVKKTVACLIVGLMIACAIPVALSETVKIEGAYAESGSWTQSTADDFKNGTFDISEIAVNGSSKDGSLGLAGNNVPGVIVPKTYLPSPSGMVAHSLSFDSGAGAMILFGGGWPSGSNSTWVFSTGSNTWRNATPAHSPPARYGAKMVYCKNTGFTVLFGGHYAPLDAPLSDTWKYDISKNQWTELSPPVSPPARQFHSMAYDSDRGVVVMFGGRNNSGLFNDTWEYNPITNVWTGPVGGPAGLVKRVDATLVYDQRQKKCLLYGGANSMGTELDDSWAYDGKWTDATPFSTPPPGRSGHAMVHDVDAGRSIVFGGYTLGGGYSNQLMEYDWINREWDMIAPKTDTIPPAVSGAVMVYDDRNSVSLLFGGVGAYPSKPSNTVWSFDYQSLIWTNLTLRPYGSQIDQMVQRVGTHTFIGTGLGTHSYNADRDTWSELEWASITDDTAIFHDPVSDTIISYGGMVGYTLSDATKEFSFSTYTWSALPTPTNPGKRSMHAIVYDSVRHHAIMFGGKDAANYRNDMWIFNCTHKNWSIYMFGGPAPDARADHSLGIDPANGRMILFGGENHKGCFGDTWVFDFKTSKWTNVTSLSSSPSPRSGAFITRNAANNTFLLFGGRTFSSVFLNDLWEFDPATNKWSLKLASTPLSGRCDAVGGYCPWNGKTYIMYGHSEKMYDDIWTYPSHTPNGIFTSSKHDTGMALFGKNTVAMNPGLLYKKVWWNGTGPFGGLSLQIRTADTAVALDGAVWHGPTSTEDKYTIPGTDINPIHKDANGRWIQYRVFFNTSNPATTPELMDITITFVGDYVVSDILVPVGTALIATIVCLTLTISIQRTWKIIR